MVVYRKENSSVQKGEQYCIERRIVVYRKENISAQKGEYYCKRKNVILVYRKENMY